jgi:predicted phosphodiesterase
MKIAVLSDIHALASSYAQALPSARSEGFDHMVILGDLLTYGLEPQKTLDLTQEAVERDGAVLISGNHDELYFRAAEGNYHENLPSWIRESVEFTAKAANLSSFEHFSWKTEWVCRGIFFAHANPFGYGDWSYLKDKETARRASEELGRRCYSAGVFGHVHRAQQFYFKGRPPIFTVGSIGQPRDKREPVPQWAMLTIKGEGAILSPRRIEMDIRRHIDAIASTTLSPETKNRLVSFFL